MIARAMLIVLAGTLLSACVDSDRSASGLGGPSTGGCGGSVFGQPDWRTQMGAQSGSASELLTQASKNRSFALRSTSGVFLDYESCLKRIRDIDNSEPLSSS